MTYNNRDSSRYVYTRENISDPERLVRAYLIGKTGVRLRDLMRDTGCSDATCRYNLRKCQWHQTRRGGPWVVGVDPALKALASNLRDYLMNDRRCEWVNVADVLRKFQGRRISRVMEAAKLLKVRRMHRLKTDRNFVAGSYMRLSTADREATLKRVT